MSSSYRMELDRWLANLDVKADRVLDIGGAQLQMPNRVKSWDVKEYLIADLENPHADSPKPDMILDLNKDDSPDERTLTEGLFDIVFCLEVMDYVWNPKQAMIWISSFMQHKGIAWVTFPMVYPTHQPIEDDALRYMEGGIRKLAEASGLKIVQMIPRRPETDAVEQLWRRERMRAAKHYDHNITGWIVEFQK